LLRLLHALRAPALALEWAGAMCGKPWRRLGAVLRQRA
jgi:hypothetical protein